MFKNYTMSISKNEEKYNVLSLLRVLACILVLRGHYFALFELPKIVGRIPLAGVGPVAIFFVISGFLAYDGFDKNPNIKSYYIRRLIKIVPIYYFILLVCVVTDFFILLGTENIGFWGWLRYFTFTNMLIPSTSFDNFNNLFGFWTMGCFPIFYLMVPFLYKLMSSLRRVIWLIIAMLGVNILSKTLILVIFGKFGFDGADSFGNLNPLGTLYLFVFGMAAAYAYRKSEEKTVAVAFGAVFLLMLTLEKGGYVFWGLAVSIICLMPNWGRLSENSDAHSMKKMVDTSG